MHINRVLYLKYQDLPDSQQLTHTGWAGGATAQTELVSALRDTCSPPSPRPRQGCPLTMLKSTPLVMVCLRCSARPR